MQTETTAKDTLVNALSNGSPEQQDEQMQSVMGTPARPKLPLVGSLNVPVCREEEQTCYG